MVIPTYTYGRILWRESSEWEIVVLSLRWSGSEVLLYMRTCVYMFTYVPHSQDEKYRVISSLIRLLPVALLN